MLIDFRVSNFRSFHEEQTLSMVASSGVSEHSDHLIPLGKTGEHLLRSAVIWGANGAGKSNLFKAIEEAATLILDGTEPREEIDHQPHFFSGIKNSNRTTFEFRFLTDGKIYSYGFDYNSKHIMEEWLTHEKGSSAHDLFTRKTDIEGKTTLTLSPTLQNKAHEKIEALVLLGVRANQLFLTAIRENIDQNERGSQIEPILDFFENRLTFIAPGAPFRSLTKLMVQDSTFADFAANFLAEADTGVSGLEVVSRTLDPDTLPAPFRKDQLGTFIDKAPPGKMLTLGSGDSQITLVKGKSGTVQMKAIHAHHQNNEGMTQALPLFDESDGTQRLLNLIPALHQLQNENRVFVVDEIDLRLHPKMTQDFVNFFLKNSINSSRQLIMTSHEDRLLNLDILRRDEIWFVEKNNNSSKIYPLTDFNARKDLKIDKGYLNGRFGAIPRTNNLESLLNHTETQLHA